MEKVSPEGSRCRVLVNGSLQSSMAHRSVSTPALLMIGTALLNYGFSLVDVWAVAGEDFLYPTYAELFIAGGSVMSHVSGASESGFGPTFDLVYKGRRIFFQMGLKAAIPFMVMGASMHSRFIITEHFFMGLGLLYSIDFGWEHDETANPPDQLVSPAVSISYRTTRFEGDLILSPYAWLADEGRNLLGFRGKAGRNYFFGLKAGMPAPVEDANMKDVNQGSDYDMQMLLASVGLVLRL